MHTAKDPKWMDSFFTRNNWSTNRYDDQLSNSWMAAARIMLAAATLLSNDPVKISRYLSLPLPYTAAMIWNLDRNIHWMTEGYKDLAMLVSADPVDEEQLCDALHSAMEQFWEMQQPARIDLIRLWASISWATGDDLLPNPVARGRAA
ncbi:MAG: hypothetical protein WA708_14860 [Acidobacteriaceae bacterium]